MDVADGKSLPVVDHRNWIAPLVSSRNHPKGYDVPLPIGLWLP